MTLLSECGLTLLFILACTVGAQACNVDQNGLIGSDSGIAVPVSFQYDLTVASGTNQEIVVSEIIPDLETSFAETLASSLISACAGAGVTTPSSKYTSETVHPDLVAITVNATSFQKVTLPPSTPAPIPPLILNLPVKTAAPLPPTTLTDESSPVAPNADSISSPVGESVEQPVESPEPAGGGNGSVFVILGIVLAFVLLGAGGFMYYRRRFKKKPRKGGKKNGDDSDDDSYIDEEDDDSDSD
ncbi:hypothetical protein MHU86_19985 [Fragilaria crotonensis]|nr:hypothetical protein MHU86_19985 [Fragilaria crotonensis]